MDNPSDEQRQEEPGPDKGHWLFRRRSLDGIFWGLILVSAALGLADLFYQRKTKFYFEEIPGFFGIVGFVVCVGLVLGAKELRKILKRDEDYYDR